MCPCSSTGLLVCAPAAFSATWPLQDQAAQIHRQKLVMLQQATLQRLGPVGQQQLSMLPPEQRKAQMLELMKDTQRLQQHQQQVGLACSVPNISVLACRAAS